MYKCDLYTEFDRGSNPGGGEFSAPFRTVLRAHPACHPMGTETFLGVKRSGRVLNHPSPLSVEVQERIELYFYYPSEPSWPVLGRNVPFYLKCGNSIHTLFRNVHYTYQTTLCHDPQDCSMNPHRHENLKCHILCYLRIKCWRQDFIIRQKT